MDATKLIEEAGREIAHMKAEALSAANPYNENTIRLTLLIDIAAALKASEDRARKAKELAAANLAANKRIVELEQERDAALLATQEAQRLAFNAEQKAKALDAVQRDTIARLEAQTEELRAELARLTTPRPIAEAPRDGTWILGYWDETTRWDVGRYSRFLVVQWLHDEWLDEDGDELNAPSHYLPLPEVKP